MDVNVVLGYRPLMPTNQPSFRFINHDHYSPTTMKKTHLHWEAGFTLSWLAVFPKEAENTSGLNDISKGIWIYFANDFFQII